MGYVVLFDYDSLIYHSVYKIVSLSDIKKLFKKYKTKEAVRKEIIFDSVSRLENMTLSVLNDIESCGVEISSVEYFLTTCKNSVRKNISADYKAKRKSNKWVSLVRANIIDQYNCHHDDQWEADDLIADFVKSSPDNVIICSIDKDLKQIKGLHYNYMYNYAKDENGNYKLDAWGNKIKTTRKGLSSTSEWESNLFLATQMLMGDDCDGVVGIPRLGVFKAKKILDGASSLFGLKKRVINAYIDYSLSVNKKNKPLLDKLVELNELPDEMGMFKTLEINRVQAQLIEFDYRIELLKNYRLLKLGTL